MRLLFLGDIVGKPGRRAVRECLPRLRERWRPDLIIANAENAAGGFGLTRKVCGELLELGIDILTMGNHTWDNKEILQFIEAEPRLIRPLNYPPGVPGRGAVTLTGPGGTPVTVVNLTGRTFVGDFDCPFRAMDRFLAELPRGEDRPVIFVDIHAETTSEKCALGRYLAGRVTAVVGTHTHVQTADAQVLPGETAYLTDAGMTGPTDSILGIKSELIIERFLTQMPRRFEVASGPAACMGAVVETRDHSGVATGIWTFQERVGAEET